MVKKLTTGSIDVLAAAKTVKDSEAIAEDIILLFDEMYLQKYEEYCGGDTFRTNEDGELYKGIMCFMIIGLKNNCQILLRQYLRQK